MIGDRLVAERDKWIRLFHRLEAAVNHHERGKCVEWVDEIDAALYAARDRIVRDAAVRGRDVDHETNDVAGAARFERDRDD